MTKPVDPAALDPETRRLAERGAREAYGVSLDRVDGCYGRQERESAR